MGSNRRQTLEPRTSKQPRKRRAHSVPLPPLENHDRVSANSRSISLSFWQLEKRDSREMNRYRSVVGSTFLKLALHRGSELKNLL